MIWRLACFAIVGATLFVARAEAQAKKPRPPAGLDPGGVAIAILSTGIDYRLPEVAQRLARDGEGELIGWDLVDGDHRPFNAASAETPIAWGGDGTALVKAIGKAGRRVVVVRIDPKDPLSLAKALSFISHTPARIVVVPMWTRTAGAWAALGMAIKAFPDLLVIAAAGDEGRDIDREPVWPAAFGHANLLVVSALPVPGGEPSAQPNTGASTVSVLVDAPGGDSRLAAVVVADALAGCWVHLVQRHRGEALKRALLAEATKAQPGLKTPFIARCP